MPAELAADASGDVYIADLRNFRIREVTAPLAPPPPAVDSVTNAASLVAPVAPGSIVAITGRNLARGVATATAFPLPGSLAGATVNVNGAAAPVMAASSGEIVFQMPAANAGSGSVDVLRDNLDSGAAAVQIAASAPGIFTLPENQGAILNQDYGVNDPGLPAKAGTEVMLWATGQGATAPAVAAGTAAPAIPLATTPQTPVVTIGGIPAQVLFSGLAPGYAGLWQINAVVPANAPVGDNLAVQVTLGGAASNTVTMAVGK
jgi:adhesin/invasin